MKIIIKLSKEKPEAIQHSLLLCAYMLLTFLFHLSPSTYKPAIILSLLGIAFFSFFLSVSHRYVIKLQRHTTAFWLLLFIAFVSVQWLNSTLYFYPIFILSSAAFAYFLFHNTFDIRFVYTTLLFMQFYLLFRLICGADPETIFPDTSRNYISVILLTNTAIVYIIDWKQFRNIRIWPALLTFLISIQSIGRAGIITSLFLLIAVLFEIFQQKSKKEKIYYALFLLIPFLVGLLFFSQEIIHTLMHIDFLERFLSRGITDGSRASLLRTYLDNLDMKNLLLGYDFSNDPLFIRFGLNPHNSFIDFHQRGGLLFFPALLLILVAMFKSLLHHRLYFALFVTLLLRASTDRFLFLTFYDYVLMTLIFLSFYSPTHPVDENRPKTLNIKLSK